MRSKRTAPKGKGRDDPIARPAWLGIEAAAALAIVSAMIATAFAFVVGFSARRAGDWVHLNFRKAAVIAGIMIRARAYATLNARIGRHIVVHR